MAELRVDHLCKGFRVAVDRRHLVLRDVTFTVREREFVTVIGPSGCGKSTLLNIAAGLDLPDSGAVYVDGREVRAPGLDRSVVFQDFALFPWLTVHDNIAFGLKSIRLPRADRRARVERYLSLVGLTEFAGYHPNRLSGGMRQRVGLARALAVEPAVLLMDEPFGSLDTLTRQHLRSALADICRRMPKSILFITHDIEEAVFLSDRVLVLNESPSRICFDLEIALPHPRDARARDFQDRVSRLNAAIFNTPHTVQG